MSDQVVPHGDAGIRPALLARLSGHHLDEPGTVIIEELGLCRGKVRVDVAVVNGSLHGYEIKSDRDSLRRLANQVHMYGKVLDRATLVVGERHLPKALTFLPEWWGVLRIITTTRGLQFKAVRRGRKNPKKDPRALVELLWYEDAIALLEEHNIARGLRGKPRQMLWDKICEQFHPGDIATVVRTQLKTRAMSKVLP